jgi:hypothetical protein
MMSPFLCATIFLVWFEIKDTGLGNVGRIKAANNFIQQLALVLYILETQTLIA